tara:strand:+ start:129 stop:365 length:237 start_codon:yes stop_codon:yes gene_type:complete
VGCGKFPLKNHQNDPYCQSIGNRGFGPEIKPSEFWTLQDNIKLLSGAFFDIASRSKFQPILHQQIWGKYQNMLEKSPK